jgi:predicted regulator of Ras-like GTPase activity (Roadblock/LC7/MglB family)
MIGAGPPGAPWTRVWEVDVDVVGALVVGDCGLLVSGFETDGELAAGFVGALATTLTGAAGTTGRD